MADSENMANLPLRRSKRGHKRQQQAQQQQQGNEHTRDEDDTFDDTFGNLQPRRSGRRRRKSSIASHSMFSSEPTPPSKKKRVSFASTNQVKEFLCEGLKDAMPVSAINNLYDDDDDEEEEEEDEVFIPVQQPKKKKKAAKKKKKAKGAKKQALSPRRSPRLRQQQHEPSDENAEPHFALFQSGAASAPAEGEATMRGEMSMEMTGSYGGIVGDENSAPPAEGELIDVSVDGGDGDQSFAAFQQHGAAHSTEDDMTQVGEVSMEITGTHGDIIDIDAPVSPKAQQVQPPQQSITDLVDDYDEDTMVGGVENAENVAPVAVAPPAAAAAAAAAVPAAEPQKLASLMDEYDDEDTNAFAAFAPQHQQQQQDGGEATMRGEVSMEFTGNHGIILEVNNGSGDDDTVASEVSMEMTTNAYGSIHNAPVPEATTRGDATMEMTTAMHGGIVAQASDDITVASEVSMEITAAQHNDIVVAAPTPEIVVGAPVVDKENAPVVEADDDNEEEEFAMFHAPAAAGGEATMRGEETMEMTTGDHGGIVRKVAPDDSQLNLSSMSWADGASGDGIEDMSIMDVTNSSFSLEDADQFADKFVTEGRRSSTQIAVDKLHTYKRRLSSMTPVKPDAMGATGDAAAAAQAAMELDEGNETVELPPVQDKTKAPPTPPAFKLAPTPVEDRIACEQFLAQSGVSFLDAYDTLGKQERAEMSTPSRLPESMEDCMTLACVTLPELENIEWGIGELRKSAEVIEARTHAKMEEFNTHNPPCFSQLVHGREREKVPLQLRLRTLKRYSELKAAHMWYTWRAKLTQDLQKRLHAHLELMREEETTLKEHTNALRKLNHNFSEDQEIAQAEMESDSKLVEQEELLSILEGVHMWQPSRLTSDEVVLEFAGKYKLTMGIDADKKLITGAAFAPLDSADVGAFEGGLLQSANFGKLLSQAAVGRPTSALPGVLDELSFRVHRVQQITAEVTQLATHFLVESGKGDAETGDVTVTFSNAATEARFALTFHLTWGHPFSQLAFSFHSWFGAVTHDAATAAVQSVPAGFGRLGKVCAALAQLA